MWGRSAKLWDLDENQSKVQQLGRIMFNLATLNPYTGASVDSKSLYLVTSKKVFPHSIKDLDKDLDSGSNILKVDLISTAVTVVQ